MNLNNWMAFIKQSTPLFNVSIPGTHESCALHDHGTAGYTQCQWLSIPDQLANGIRFLDIRPAYNKNDKLFYIYHGSYYQKITLEKVQEQVVEFLKANPSEVVLMNIQQEEYYVSNADFVAAFNALVAAYEDYWYFEERIPTIEEARGRIVLIRGYDPTQFNPDNPDNGGWLTGKGLPWNGLTQDRGNSENSYFRTQNNSRAWETDKEPAIKGMIKEGIIDNRIVLNFLSYAHFGATPGRNAEAMNPLINEYIKNDRPDSILGTLAMDFATNTPGFIEEIIRHNLNWSEVVAGNFSGSGSKEIAVFIDKGNNTTGLSLFKRNASGAVVLEEVWSSAAGVWTATQMTKVVAGDFTGSGKTEIAVFYDYGNSRTCLWLFAADNSHEPKRLWDSGDGKWTATRMSKIVVGDFTGNGKTEIAVFYDEFKRRTSLWLFSAANKFQSQQVWDSGAVNWSAIQMFKVVAGDFSGSGKMDIAVFYDYSGSRTGLWLFSANSAQSFQSKQVWKSAEGVTWQAEFFKGIVAGDFFGSGQSEIVVFWQDPNYKNRTHLYSFSAKSAQPFEPQKVWDSGEGNWDATRMSEVVAGDFTGDGKQEIAVFYNYGNEQTGLWLFSSNGAQPFQPQKVWESDGWRATAISDILTGDFLGSGKTGIITFYYYVFPTARVFSFSQKSSTSFEEKNLWNGHLK